MLINKNSRVHLVGVGGIGMSALAQLLNCVGCIVSGSDRGSENPENNRLFDCLKHQGIKIYPQDGSFAQLHPADVVVYSTAVEPGNPDFAAAGETPLIHRSAALAEAIRIYCANAVTVAVSGSSGKTSVTSYLAEALDSAGLSVGCLNGGMVKRFENGVFPGNFHPGTDYFIFEADESDKSLINYSVDYAIILNIGCDHYAEEELARVFGEFSRKIKKGIVMSQHVAAAINSAIPENLTKIIVADSLVKATPAQADIAVTNYVVGAAGCSATLNGQFDFQLPQPGVHTALNMAAVFAMLEMLKLDASAISKNFHSLRGAGRRFELKGLKYGTIPVYDDYAHNPQKLCCCLQTAATLCSGKVVMIWQPHGYGPLNFMKETLAAELTHSLRPQDIFILLKPFYAGGTSSFKPSATEVVESWRQRNILPNAFAFELRSEAEAFIQDIIQTGDIILICGARDGTLPIWAAEIAQS